MIKIIAYMLTAMEGNIQGLNTSANTVLYWHRLKPTSKKLTITRNTAHVFTSPSTNTARPSLRSTFNIVQGLVINDMLRKLRRLLLAISLQTQRARLTNPVLGDTHLENGGISIHDGQTQRLTGGFVARRLEVRIDLLGFKPQFRMAIVLRNPGLLGLEELALVGGDDTVPSRLYGSRGIGEIGLCMCIVIPVARRSVPLSRPRGEVDGTAELNTARGIPDNSAVLVVCLGSFLKIGARVRASCRGNG